MIGTQRGNPPCHVPFAEHVTRQLDAGTLRNPGLQEKVAKDPNSKLSTTVLPLIMLAGGGQITGMHWRL